MYGQNTILWFATLVACRVITQDWLHLQLKIITKIYMYRKIRIYTLQTRLLHARKADTALHVLREQTNDSTCWTEDIQNTHQNKCQQTLRGNKQQVESRHNKQHDMINCDITLDISQSSKQLHCYSCTRTYNVPTELSVYDETFIHFCQRTNYEALLRMLCNNVWQNWPSCRDHANITLKCVTVNCLSSFYSLLVWTFT